MSEETSDNAERHLAAVLSADVAGYSRLMAEDEVATVRTLTAYRELMGELVRRHRGRVVDSPGDNLLAELPSALDAAACATEIQQALAVRNADLPPNRRMNFRIGVHLGDLMIDGERIYGDGVNIAARLERLATPGGICISATVHDQVRTKLKAHYEDLGEQEVKNIPRPVRVYRVKTEIDEPLGEERDRSPDRSPRKLVLTLAAAAVAALVVLIVTQVRFRSASAPPVAPIAAAGAARPSIAVLPFANMSADKADEYLSDGMTEDIITALSKIGGLQVAARTSAFAFKGQNEDVRKIGERLNVANVLEGSVSRAGGKLRITTQLINIADGYHLWSETYDREMKDIFAIRSDVAQRVAEALRIELKVAAKRELKKNPTEDVEAHQLYLKGRYFAAKLTKDGLQKGADYFRQAIARDPGYAMPYSGLAYYYEVISDWLSPAKEAMPKAKEAAERALDLDDTLPEAHAWLGNVNWFYERDWAAADREYHRALELDANSATSHQWYGWYLGFMGRFAEAITEGRRAEELDPLSLEAKLMTADALYNARRYDEAIEQLKRTIEMDPTYWFAHQRLGLVDAQTGRCAAAIAELQKARALEDAIPENLASLAWGYAICGKRQEATKLLEDLKERSKRRFVTSFDLAFVYAALGDRDRALQWLEKTYDERSLFVSWVKTWPLLDPLRSDPRFARVLEKSGFERSATGPAS